MDFFTLPRQTYEVSRHGWLLMTCEVWRLLRLEVIEAATMFTSCLDVQWWWSSGCAGLTKNGARGFKCHVTLPYVEIPRSLKTTSQPLFFFAKVQAQKEAREAAQKGKSRRCPTGGISHGNISMANFGRQETSERCVTSKGDVGGGKPRGWNSADTTWRISRM